MKMNSVVSAVDIRKAIPIAIYDVFALALIYLIPTFSHMLNVPLYFMEPMRLMVIISMVYAHKNNAYVLALTLPLFSFLVAAHPVFIKSLLISVELLFMVWLFFQLAKYWNSFISIFVSIIASKVLYYGLKFGAIMALMPNEAIVSIPLHVQLITTLFFSIMLFGFLRYKK